MIKQRLIKRSPIRILEKSTNGGLGKGNIGIIAAGAGVGKTACLVHMAIDTMMRGEHVIHISFNKDTQHIISWYEDIFNEVAEKHELDNARAVHDDIVKHRIIMNFIQDQVKIENVTHDVREIINDAQVRARALMIDGYDFSRSTAADIALIQQLCTEFGLEAWFSVGVDAADMRESRCKEVFSPFDEYIEIILCLESLDSHIRLKLLKDHQIRTPLDTHLSLDPKTLLITEE